MTTDELPLGVCPKCHKHMDNHSFAMLRGEMELLCPPEGQQLAYRKRKKNDKGDDPTGVGV